MNNVISATYYLPPGLPYDIVFLTAWRHYRSINGYPPRRVVISPVGAPVGAVDVDIVIYPAGYTLYFGGSNNGKIEVKKGGVMLRSKAFLTALVDAVVGVVMLVVNQFFPQYEGLAIQVWALIQPVVAAIIAYYAAEPVRALLARLR